MNMYSVRRALHCYENKNSLRTGEPANSGLSNMQLKIVRPIYASAMETDGRDALQEVGEADSASF